MPLKCRACIPASRFSTARRLQRDRCQYWPSLSVQSTCPRPLVQNAPLFSVNLTKEGWWRGIFGFVPSKKAICGIQTIFPRCTFNCCFFFHTTLDLEYLPSVWKLRRRSSTGSVGWWRGISLLFGRLPFLASVSALFLQDIKQIQIISAKKTDAFFSPLLLYNRKMHLVVPWIMRGNM